MAKIPCMIVLDYWSNNNVPLYLHRLKIIQINVRISFLNTVCNSPLISSLFWSLVRSISALTRTESSVKEFSLLQLTSSSGLSSSQTVLGMDWTFLGFSCFDLFSCLFQWHAMFGLNAGLEGLEALSWPI